jgi:hypothetical protein
MRPHRETKPFVISHDRPEGGISADWVFAFGGPPRQRLAMKFTPAGAELFACGLPKIAIRAR